MPEVSENTSTESTKPLGYRLVPPPGWDMIPLREGTDEAVKRIVDRGVAQLTEGIPKDDVIKARLELLKRLNKAAQQARKADGLTLYLPVERIHGTLVPASIVVSEALTGPGAGAGGGQVLAHLLADTVGSEPVSVDGADGVRVDRTVAADPEREVEHASRRIDYVLPVPGSPVAQWVTVCFSTIADGDPHSEFAEVLVELFDAVLTTFRWSYS